MTQQQTTLPADNWPYPTRAAGAPAGHSSLVERMPDRVAAMALVAVVFGGLLAQVLFFGQALGLNVPLWIGFVLASAVIARPKGARTDRWDIWLAPAAIVFASFAALRDEPMLLAFDLAAAGVLTLAAIVAFGGHTVTRSAWHVVAHLGAIAAFLYLAGAPFLSGGARPLAAVLRRDTDLAAWRLVRGLAIALPLVALFVVLFVAADAVFARLIRDVISFDLAQDVLPRTLLALVASWLLAGTIVVAWIVRDGHSAAGDVRPGRSLGRYEAVVVLIALNATFAAFLVVQAAYLFGGSDTLTLTGVTHSEYARRGFFELITVALLAGALIVGLARIVERRDAVFRALGALLAASTGVVLVSALVRLALYQTAYGWTELRFYALAAICWLAIGVLATIVLVAFDRVPLLSRLMVGAGVLIALACNVLGPQSYVTEQNLARALNPTLVPADGTTGLDVDYLWSLGPDSARVVLGTVDALPEPERSAARRALAFTADDLADSTALGWPSWNLARQSALDALRSAGY